MAANIIDSLFVALGFKVDTKGMDEFERKAYSVKESLMSLGTAITAFAAGFAVKEIAQIGREFENNRIAIAGFLSALGLSSDFNAGLKDADQTIKQIIKDAAALPGEADDYIQVFKAGLPFVQEALGKGAKIEDITKFTNKLTAVGIGAMNLNPALIGHEAEMLLAAQGRASKRFPLFMQLSILMRKLPGQAHLTAESFNAMSQAARFDLINKSLDLMGPALEASKSSFEALWGAVKSGIKQITRLATEGLFRDMKKALDAFNNVFYDTDGNLTELGQTIVNTGRVVGYWISRTIQFGVGLISTLIKIRGATTALKIAFAILAPVLAGLAFNKMASSIMGVVGSLFKLNGATMLSTALIGALSAAVFLIGEDLYTFFEGGDSVTGKLIEKFGMLGKVMVATAVIGAAAWLVMFAPLAAILVGLALILKTISDIAAHWEAFKILVTKLPIAMIKDMAPGAKDEHFADRVRAEAGAAWEKKDEQVAGEAATKRITGPMNGPELPPSMLANSSGGAATYGPDLPPAKGPDAWVRPAWDMLPAQRSAGGNTTVHQETHVHGGLHVSSPDPVKAGEAVTKKLEEQNRRVTRNGQGGVAY